MIKFYYYLQVVGEAGGHSAIYTEGDAVRDNSPAAVRVLSAGAPLDRSTRADVPPHALVVPPARRIGDHDRVRDRDPRSAAVHPTVGDGDPADEHPPHTVSQADDRRPERCWRSSCIAAIGYYRESNHE